MKYYRVLSIYLFAIGFMVPNFSNADNGPGPGGHHAQFQACVKKNGGTLPDLTPAQWQSKMACHKNNKGDEAAAKACEDQAGLPAEDAATQAAIKKCHPHGGPGHHHPSDAPASST